jgi:hypothetical protein
MVAARTHATTDSLTTLPSAIPLYLLYIYIYIKIRITSSIFLACSRHALHVLCPCDRRASSRLPVVVSIHPDPIWPIEPYGRLCVRVSSSPASALLRPRTGVALLSLCRALHAAFVGGWVARWIIHACMHDDDDPSMEDHACLILILIALSNLLYVLPVATLPRHQLDGMTCRHFQLTPVNPYCCPPGRLNWRVYRLAS